MLIFNEGLPRAGKSYDAVANHLIPAIKSGRHVYARLDGLNFYAIAQVSGVPEDRVRELLHVVDPGDVPALFRITVHADKTKSLNPQLRRDSLFIIDEVHEFWVAARTDLEPEVEWFFAYHGQFGLDGVLISQAYKRVHDAIRLRVERKHLFRKLNFLQKLKRRSKEDVSKRYVKRSMIAMEPDRFMVLTSEEYEYNPEIFPCYTGYRPGVENVAPYDPGFGGIFSRAQKIAYFSCIGLVAFAGIYFATKYSGGDQPAEDAVPVSSAPAGDALPSEPGTFFQPEPAMIATAATVAPTGAALATAREVRAEEGDPMVAYFVNLTQTARPRLSAVVESDNGRYALIEWRIGNAQVLERVDSRDLEALGFVVTIHERYATLEAEGQKLLATRFPLDSPYSGPGAGTGAPTTVPSSDGLDLAPGGPSGASSAAGSGYDQIAAYGHFRPGL
ncbi:zonular occludens toxin domain-containing protein [Luteimonas sp. M1R5S18]|uniref:Zonular occludens toxin domain-containing protein n=1 Tax=Luteimonas rhizosphaericola TaxID=3042024 RepID=A0ABT6JGD3_9GAMM|nr:zonular occludens toxin domain-containing protein [Luteimonas rhizosphaericola]MDH5829714.1 zonular occludens toxin domain-containing protein [Luteimonas rhizosphaericola]